MATVKLRQALIIDGHVVEGDVHADSTLTLTNGQVFQARDVTVADNFGTATLWTTGDGGMTTFETGFIESDKDIVIELRNDDSGTPEFALLFVAAGVLTAIPNKVGGGTSERLDGAVLVDNTDFADVDRIEIQRDVADDVGDAVVSLFLFN